MKLSYLWRGLPGHPIHPPLTDATIGIYTFATVAAFAEVLGITENSGAYGWWIALIAGLIFTVPTALTGLVDWLTIAWRSELWKTATYHVLGDGHRDRLVRARRHLRARRRTRTGTSAAARSC